MLYLVHFALLLKRVPCTRSCVPVGFLVLVECVQFDVRTRELNPMVSGAGHHWHCVVDLHAKRRKQR
eukprot:3637857-Rhodomonas_salina.4